MKETDLMMGEDRDTGVMQTDGVTGSIHLGAPGLA